MEKSNEKIENSNKRKKAEEILKSLSEKYAEEGKDIEKFLESRKPKQLRVRARIPVTITPEVKRSLRQKESPEEKAEVNVIVDFKDPKGRKGRIRISDQKRKDKERMVTLQAPEIPSSLSSSESIIRQSINKDQLKEKLKKKQKIKKERKGRK
ncbi:MAG: hypothetical protein ACFFD7_01290 [Candidatus Thorarchaeota archaeon]